jgi:hypothetical protein
LGEAVKKDHTAAMNRDARFPDSAMMTERTTMMVRMGRMTSLAIRIMISMND